MRKYTFAFTVVVLLTLHLTAAQTVARWQWNAPEGEDFTVLMPQRNLRVRRELPFAAQTKVTPYAYEAVSENVGFCVLSFEKSRLSSFNSLSAFVEGFRYALLHSPLATDNEMTFERGLNLGGHAGQQYSLRANGKRGTARIYETPEHYYVVMSIGGVEGDAKTNRFLNSFALGDKKSNEDSDVETSDLVAPTTTTPKLPLSNLWHVAGSDVRSFDGNAEQPKPKTIISGGILNGKAISKPQPPYPAIARAARAQGTVVVQIVWDEEGSVISAQAVSGHPLLQQAGVQAARQARFSPTRLQGQPVKVSGVITYNFVLTENPPDKTPTKKY